MAKTEIEIIGIQELSNIFAQLPEKYGKKPVVAAFRKGAAIFSKQLKQSTPTASGDTRKSIKVKALRGAAINVGFQGKGNMPAYFKAYWNNYGTLSNRNASHQFKKSRKRITANWSGGIRAGGFVENAWEQTKNTVQTTINTELETQTVKFLQKHAIQ
jgi:HK97 gp10 family phage protein